MSRKIKVLILSHSSELGGAERSMLDLFDYWTSKGLVEPHFVIRRPLDNLAKELRKRNWGYTAIHYTNWSQRTPSKRAEDIFRNATFNTKAIFAIEKAIQKLKPDLVITNTIVSPWAAVAAYFQKVPHVWFVREYGDIDHQHIFELGREKMLQDIDTLSSLVVTNSKTLAKHLQPLVDKNKTTTLYTPFDLEALRQKSLQSAKNPFKSEGSLKLVITGKITRTKGQDEAAQAVANLNKLGFDTELCVIGTPKEQGDDELLKKIIEDNHLSSKVHLVGEQANPLAVLKYADIGIMASKQEAFGRVTFEYMAVGRPVIGANSGATPEMIEHGKNGYLYELGSTESLTNQLLNYAQNRNLLAEHGDAAKKKAEKMMQGENNADTLFSKIATLVGASNNNLPQPLNFSHRWLEYPTIAERYIKDTHAVAIYRIMYLRARHGAKLTYLWVVSLFDNDKKLN